MKTKRSLEEIYSSAVTGLYARIRSNYDHLYRKFGSEGISLIADMSHEYGLSVAARAHTALNSRDIDAVAGYLSRIFETVTYGKGIVHRIQDEPGRVIIKVDKCPLSFDKPEMCLAHTTMEKTVVEELNSELTYRIGKSIPAGDAYCEHILEIKR